MFGVSHNVANRRRLKPDSFVRNRLKGMKSKAIGNEIDLIYQMSPRPRDFDLRNTFLSPVPNRLQRSLEEDDVGI